MSYSHFVRAVSLLLSLLCSVSFAPVARSIEVREYFVQKFNFGPPFFNIELLQTSDFLGPGLNDPGADYLWHTRAGTWAPGDINDGLHLNPGDRGTLFSLNGHSVKAQIIELLTPLSGPGAFNNVDNTTFDFGATFRNVPYEEGTFAGIGFSNLGHQSTSQDPRAFGIGVTRRGGEHYVMSKNFLTGQRIDWQPIDFDQPFIELYMSHRSPGSELVDFGYFTRNVNGAVIDQYSLGTITAFSDVVLRPAIFATAPIPEPRTHAMMLAGLALVVLLGRRRMRAA